MIQAPKSMPLELKRVGLGLVFMLTFSIMPMRVNPSTQDLLSTPISLQFTDIEVVELLQVLAKLGNTNFLLSESIKGKITIDLNNTPWQTALHSIIASRGFNLARMTFSHDPVISYHLRQARANGHNKKTRKK
jgi:type IV pilus assembly protein PilQ